MVFSAMSLWRNSTKITLFLLFLPSSTPSPFKLLLLARLINLQDVVLRGHRSSRDVKRKNHNVHPFIVASFNAQSVKVNDMAYKREISAFINDNGVDLFL